MSAGFSESDFTRLVNGAARYALFRRSKETDQPLSEVTTDDFLEALKRLQYVVTNNGFSTKPDVTWDDVWGLDHIRQQLYEHVIRPFKSPEECKVSEDDGWDIAGFCDSESEISRRD
ncbi:hypothetical protein ISN44_As09g007830 [Arabidopsis suecica]|uniref:Uncharacterized protein n=1 Tax=Arabidopsis suecica TaxID=45249 RepID=A0A8T2AG19_ARASU|nr:hypothetical protein ISN44_As09g007830 [Arabidopsis suecica]